MKFRQLSKIQSANQQQPHGNPALPGVAPQASLPLQPGISAQPGTVPNRHLGHFLGGKVLIGGSPTGALGKLLSQKMGQLPLNGNPIPGQTMSSPPSIIASKLGRRMGAFGLRRPLGGLIGAMNYSNPPQ
jgi:hypothetical protein